MNTEIPYFEYQPPNRLQNVCGAIKLHGEVLHKIDKMDEFYKELGYTQEMAKKEIWPDEFIWETYFKITDKNCSSCYQQHIVDYLLAHSDAFASSYRRQSQDWLATYAAARAACIQRECIQPEKSSPQVFDLQDGVFELKWGKQPTRSHT